MTFDPSTDRPWSELWTACFPGGIPKEVHKRIRALRAEDPPESGGLLGGFAPSLWHRYWPWDTSGKHLPSEDQIIHGLSHICRYNGQTPYLWTVLDHCLMGISVLREEGAPPEEILQFAWHDATEAVLGDVIGPLKKYLPGYHLLEHRWAVRLSPVVGVDIANLSPLVEAVDKALALVEGECFFGGTEGWSGWTSLASSGHTMLGYRMVRELRCEERSPEQTRRLFRAEVEDLRRAVKR